jgi:peptide-methionine (S)-S-oxide reductase
MRLFFFLLALLSCGPKTNQKDEVMSTAQSQNKKLEVATFGEGCFWCTEAVFQRLDGVASVVSGYSGGQVDNPTYEQVCSGQTGHAEVSQITFDPAKIAYEELLDVFFSTHNPTTLNRQGNDEGTQYRSVIFYHDGEQKSKAEAAKKKFDDLKLWDDPIVTEIASFTKFYKAEDYHQNYFNQNGNQPYCSFIINPKVQKFKKQFKHKLKNEEE